MITVELERAGADGSFGLAESLPASRKHLATAEHLATANVSVTKRCMVYRAGLGSALARQASVGDRLDGRWRIARVVASRGAAEILTEEL